MKHTGRAASPRVPEAVGGGKELFLLEIVVASEAADDVAAFLVEQTGGGVEETPAPKGSRLSVYGEDRAGLDAIAAHVRPHLRENGIPARVTVRKAPAASSAWETDWMRYLGPVRISRTLTLVPTTAAVTAPLRGNVVRLEPAMAFGFGEHPTTRLVARALERQCRVLGARSVLDVGTGSGVLAIIAAVSGAERVLGIDVDARSIAAAKANASINDVNRKCRFSPTPAARVRSRFDVVVANIDLNALVSLAPALVRSLEPGGRLLLTGVLTEHCAELEARYVDLGLVRVGRKSEAGWGLVTFKKDGSRGLRVRQATARGTIRKTKNR